MKNCPKCNALMKTVAVGGLTLTRKVYRCPDCGYREADEITRERISKTR